MAIALFATDLYALPILRPIQKAAVEQGEQVAWIVPKALASRLAADEVYLSSLKAVKSFNPESVFCASNWVSNAIPGNKIQVFHGFSTDKRSRERGHFRIRGFFDLYCTQGPSTTEFFKKLAKQYGHFAVEETGWPKVDPLFQKPSLKSENLRVNAGQRPCVMYASTFTPRLSAAPAMLAELEKLVARGDRYWLLTLHPKCDPELFAAYRALAEKYSKNTCFLDSEYLLDMLQAADVLVCDTSSVIDEMAVQLKPVVTINNRIPKPFMLNVEQVEAVDAAINQALARPTELMDNIRAHVDQAHPWQDGESSKRVLQAAKNLHQGGYGKLKHKPLNLVRRYKAHKKIKEFF